MFTICIPLTSNRSKLLRQIVSVAKDEDKASEARFPDLRDSLNFFKVSLSFALEDDWYS